MPDTFYDLLEHQLKLQRESFGIDPTDLTPEQRAKYVQSMSLALIVEIGEALQEVSWKPWASGQFFNRAEYMVELIDALHFWLNLVLVASSDPKEITDAYYDKAAVNAQRQAEGYTGMDKCPACGRANDE